MTIDEARRTLPPHRPAPASELKIAGPLDARIPAIGIAATRVTPGAASAIELMRPNWLVAKLDLIQPDHQALAAAAALAERCMAAVQLELLVPGASTPDIEVEQGAALCAQAGLRPEAVLVCPRPLLKSYQPTDQWPALPALDAFYAAARASFPEGRIGGGMVTYFTELNRCRPAGAGIDFISHTTAAIVHAADDQWVMQTLETLPHIARSVHALWPGLEYRIGPSSLAMRSNPYGETTVRNEGRRRLALASEDPRHAALFAAASGARLCRGARRARRGRAGAARLRWTCKCASDR